MHFEFKGQPFAPSNSFSPEEELALAAAGWTNLGIVVELQKNGQPYEDPRTPAQRKDPVATFFALSELRGLSLAVKTGPKTGLLAVTAYTFDADSGLNALQKAGLFCACCDTAIRHESIVDGQCGDGFHTVLYYVGKDSFRETVLHDLPGVVVRESGELTIIPPGISYFGQSADVGIRSTYEGQDILSPSGIKCLPDGLRRMIRAAERQALAANRKPKVGGGVLRELYTPVVEGGRNNAMTRRAGFLLGVRKMTEQQALEALLDINQRCCQPPLDACEVRAVIRSIAKRERRDG